MSNQSGVIFGYLAVGFLVYITLKGELPIYAGLLLLPPGGSGSIKNSGSGIDTSAITSEIIQGAILAA